MTAEIVPFPTSRPWAKYTYDAASRARTERVFECLLDMIEIKGGDPQEMIAEAERETVKVLQMCREGAARLRGDPPPAS